MFFETIQQLIHGLRNVHAILDKAQKHADAKKFDSANYLSMRVSPDMFPFTRQVQIVCDTAKFAASRLSGVDAPSFEDSEKTLAELSQRIEKTIAVLEGYKKEQFQDAAERRLTLPRREGKFILGRDYLMQHVIPNFYFHSAMVYGLLRSGGVDIGKADFLGKINFQEA